MVSKAKRSKRLRMSEATIPEHLNWGEIKDKDGTTVSFAAWTKDVRCAIFLKEGTESVDLFEINKQLDTTFEATCDSFDIALALAKDRYKSWREAQLKEKQEKTDV